VKLNTFKGKQLIDIREYYEDKETGEMKPGKKGLFSLSLSYCEYKFFELLFIKSIGNENERIAQSEK
jgi:hypothetical protein